MIFIIELGLRVVGEEMSLLGIDYSVRDFLKGDIDHNYITQEEYETGKRVLMTNQNWGENETQWEEALASDDQKLLELIIRQGKCLKQAVEKSLEEQFRTRSHEIHRVLHNYLDSLSDIKSVEELDDIFNSLATCGTAQSARCIAAFADPDGKAFKSIEDSSLEEFVLEYVALRSKNTELLEKIAKEHKDSNTTLSTTVLTSLLSNPNTPNKVIDIVSNNPSAAGLDALIKTNNNPEQYIKMLIEDIENDVFRGIHIKPLLTSVEWIANTLENNPEKRDALQHLIDKLGELVMNNQDIACFYLSNIKSQLIISDDKDITLKLLDNPEKSRHFFFTTDRLNLDRYLVAAIISTHSEVLKKVWEVTKRFYEESVEEEDFHNLYPGAELRGIDACALALYHNPNTPKDILDVIDDCKLPMVIFFNHNAGSYNNNTHPYYNLEEAIKAREEYIRSTLA